MLAAGLEGLKSKEKEERLTSHHCAHTGDQIDGLGLDARVVVGRAEARLSSLCAAPSDCKCGC